MGIQFFLIIAIIWIFLAPAILKWLWNMTLPELFDFKVIEYWQSFRLIIILAILSGGGIFSIIMKN